jgi:glutamate--cysteine ligase catalytic subunit
MGFLEVGSPMTWQDDPEYQAVLDYVHDHGIIQFIKIWRLVKDRKGDELKWGDELVSFCAFWGGIK